MKYLSKVFYLQLGVCILFFLSAAGCSKKGQESEVKASSPSSEVVAETTLLATIADDEKPLGSAATAGHSMDPAVQNQPVYFQVVFNETGKGVAYIAEKSGQGYVVHNGKAGKPYQSIGSMAVSPDGLRIAYGAQVNDKWRMVIDGKEEVIFDEAGEPVFSPDSRHIAYAARSGEKWQIVLDNTMKAIAGSENIPPVFSADSKMIAYVEKVNDQGESRIVVSKLAFKTESIKESIGVQLLANIDKTKLASVKKNGNQQSVIEFSFSQPDAVKEGSLYDGIDKLTFGSDGISVAYTAKKDGKNYIVLNGREETLPDGDLAGPLVVQPDNKGVGIIMISQDGFFLHQAFFQDGVKENKYEEASALVYSRDGSLHAYTARRGNNWFVVLNGKEGSAFDRVVTPLFSPDSRQLIYRARKDGKRFVVVTDRDGNVINQHPAYEQVFQPVFTADGKSIAYGVKDGNKLIWKVEKLGE